MTVGIVNPAPFHFDGSEYTTDSPTFNSFGTWSGGFEGAELVTFVADGRRRRGHFRVRLNGMRVIGLPCPMSRFEQSFVQMPLILTAVRRVLRQNRDRWRAVILFDHHGMVPEVPQLEALWERASVFVVPYTTLADGVPRVIFEAMAHGVPVIATAIGGIPRVIEDEVSGVLVPPRDPAALGRAIGMLMTNPALRARLSEQAFSAARRYTSESVSRILPGMLASAAMRSGTPKGVCDR